MRRATNNMHLCQHETRVSPLIRNKYIENPFLGRVYECLTLFACNVIACQKMKYLVSNYCCTVTFTDFGHVSKTVPTPSG